MDTPPVYFSIQRNARDADGSERQVRAAQQHPEPAPVPFHLNAPTRTARKVRLRRVFPTPGSQEPSFVYHFHSVADPRTVRKMLASHLCVAATRIKLMNSRGDAQSDSNSDSDDFDIIPGKLIYFKVRAKAVVTQSALDGAAPPDGDTQHRTSQQSAPPQRHPADTGARCQALARSWPSRSHECPPSGT
eukprot:4574192-Amphidinium_carterae.3